MMRLITSFAAAAMIAVSAFAANAVSAAPNTTDVNVSAEPAPDPGSPSMIAAFLVAGVLVSLLTAAAIASE